MNAFFKYMMIFALTVLFGTSLIYFISSLQITNNAQQNILGENSSLSALNNSMGSFMTGFSSASKVQQNSSLSEQSINPTGALLLPSILTSLGRFISLPILFITALFNSISEVIGISPVLLGFISAIILLAGIFSWYRSLKQG